MAHTLRGDVPNGLVFHADRGTQFTSEKLWEVCHNLGIAQSVGRTGVCFDNAMAESFERVKLFVCGAGFIGICRSGRGRPRPFG